MPSPRILQTILIWGAAACGLMLGACASGPPPEERTDDGLVRVPSRASGGVYRSPDAEFTRYRRLMIEPLTVEFAGEWRKAHPEVTDTEIRRIQAQALALFREEFVEVLVGEGPYELAETRDPDVLHVIPRSVDVNIPAPESDAPSGTRSYSPHPVRMQMNGELRDAATGALLLRVIMFEGQERYGFNELRLANRVTNAHEMRVGFRKWAHLVREALDVAKVQRPKDPPKPDTAD
jgi:hypothetical protein